MFEEEAGPYPVTPRDDAYEVIVGWLRGSFYFRVREDGEHVDGGGLDGEMPHLVQLLDATWVMVDWMSETALVSVLRDYDAALISKVPEIERLLAAA